MHVFEYAYTRRRVAESPGTIQQPREVARIVAQAMIGDRESEALLVIATDTKNHVIGVETVYTGNVSASLVRVAELFRFAIRANASGIVLAHNHPSGDPTPSPDDLHLTAAVLAAARILEIRFMDHVVVAEGGAYRSLRESGVAFDA